MKFLKATSTSWVDRKKGEKTLLTDESGTD